MINFRYGPDGSVHVIDWYDKNQCHSTNPDLHQKTLGRIFKISHETDRWSPVDLEEAALGPARRSAAPPQRLVRAARAPDSAGARVPIPTVHAGLKRILREQTDPTRKLRALWALHVTGGLTEDDLLTLARRRQRVRPQLGGDTPRRRRESVGGRAAALRRPRAHGSVAARAALDSRARCSASRSRSAGTS